MTTLYPWGYQKYLVSLPRLKELARIDLMEPEYASRLFAWLESKGGRIGLGSSVRFTQPTGSTFAPAGKSFHLMQRMRDGKTFFMAVDLVARNGTNIHRAPRWDEVPKQGSGHSDIRNYGVHCNVSTESWHMQAIEIDGYDSWVNNGRPRPNPNFAIKGSTSAPSAPVEQAFSPGERTIRVTTPRMHGIDIAYIQQTLSRQNLPLKDDGYYGPTTAEAVKVVQGRKGLKRTGIVGANTWAVIIAYNNQRSSDEGPIQHAVGSRVLKLRAPTMRGNDVLWVQNVIKKQGLIVSVDSIYGKQVVALVKVVQGWNDLTRDGVCGPKTFEALKRY